MQERPLWEPFDYMVMHGFCAKRPVSQEERDHMLLMHVMWGKWGRTKCPAHWTTAIPDKVSKGNTSNRRVAVCTTCPPPDDHHGSMALP